MLNLSPKGYCDIYFKKYDDMVIASKPIVLVRNIFLGQLYVDFDKTLTFISQKTGAKAEFNLHPRTSSQRSHVTGACYNKEG